MGKTGGLTTGRRAQNAPAWFCPFLGIVGVRVWLGCLPYGQQVLGDGSLDLLLSTLFRGLFPVAVVLVARARPLGAKARRGLNVSATIVMIVLGELVWAGVLGDASLVALVVGSMMAGWLYIQWGEVYARLSLPTALLHICVSLSLAPLLVIGLTFLPPLLTGAALLVFPLMGCVAFERSFAAGLQRFEVGHASRTPSFGKGDSKWIISMAIYSFVWGIMQALPFGGAVAPTSMYHVVYRVAGALIVLVPLVQLYLLKSDFNLLSMWYVITAVTTASFLMVLVSDGALNSVALTLFATANYFILAYWWIRVVDFSQRSSRPPYVVFAFGWALMLVFTAFGELMAKWMGKLDNSMVILVSLGVFLVVVYLIALSRLEGRKVRAAEVPQVIIDLEAAPASIDEAVERSIERAAVAYRLTKREKEIVVLLCQGRTLQFCADKLGISLNTVRGHTKRLYAKLDVHSKEEMLDVLQKHREPASGDTKR
ncbi:helix-turn-helix transcriptional regulator [Arabiibacter massiliensis]|uniref:helix-turn-helix transcriptional regulator n=1 Tax=Arabiibacter massiliensis TaxID=1870985 RepID=UPI00155ABD71|nr:LuxR C-terminal-related transcriptional regulator [Arabiibacter massiliensis]